MLQIIVTITLMILIFGGFFVITLNRKEGRELKKSCGCSIPGDEGASGTSCAGSCNS
ncbi:MAG: hypothetical protein WCX31_03875 [Salinivirgaceae bacterium]